MELNQLAANAVNDYIETKLTEKVNTSVSKMVDSIIEDAFRDWSPIGKEITKSINESLKLEIGRFKLLDYSGMIATAVNQRISELVQEQGVAPIIRLVENHIGRISTPTIKLQQIADLFIKEAETDEYSDERQGEISFHVTEKERWFEIWADKESKRPKDCQLEFLIGKDDGRIFLFRTKNNWEQQSQVTPSKLSKMSDVEMELFRMYAAGTVVTDLDEFIETSWSKDDY